MIGLTYKVNGKTNDVKCEDKHKNEFKNNNGFSVSLQQILLANALVLTTGFIFWGIFVISHFDIFKNIETKLGASPRSQISKENHIVSMNNTSGFNATEDKLCIVNRLQWLAQPPSGSLDPLQLPVSLIILHHTGTAECLSQSQCIFQMRHLQIFHTESNGWNDIAYNFVIGGDGKIYEGRSWDHAGAHTVGWNKLSIGVAFIGTYNKEVPAPNMLSAFQKLLEIGKKFGYLTDDFKIMGAMQFSGTKSPGKAFYKIIKTWKRWCDLKDIKVLKNQ